MSKFLIISGMTEKLKLDKPNVLSGNVCLSQHSVYSVPHGPLAPLTAEPSMPFGCSYLGLEYLGEWNKAPVHGWSDFHVLPKSVWRDNFILSHFWLLSLYLKMPAVIHS